MLEKIKSKGYPLSKSKFMLPVKQS